MLKNEQTHPIEVDEGAILKRKPDFQLEQLDDEMLLFHPNEETIVYLNQTGSLIWSMCDGERTVGEMIELLSQAYPDAHSAIPGEVQTTLQEFLKAGCIELQNGPST